LAAVSGSPSPSARIFPEGFLWGAAGCAHQTEGNNTNSDWWEHELASGTNAAEPSGNACDSYNRYEEDWRLAAESGQNSTRFSVEWARIEPEPGVFSSKEIDHYRDVIGSARDLGLKTCVTLHHFTVPTWFARGGGWGSGEAVQAFAAMPARCASRWAIFSRSSTPSTSHPSWRSWGTWPATCRRALPTWN
jgi:beta-glucosidase